MPRCYKLCARRPRCALFFISALFLLSWLLLAARLLWPWGRAAAGSSSASSSAAPCCSADSPWVCVDGAASTGRAKAPSQRALSIAFVTYATGPYNEFAEGLWASIQRFAFAGHDVRLVLFTDRAGDGDFLPHPRVLKKHQARVGWPYDTLGRHFLYLQNLDMFVGMDYVIAIDSDALIVAPLDPAMLGERMACLQAWSFGQARALFKYDARTAFDGSPFSTSYIAPTEGTCYFCGGIFGGSLAGFTSILQRTVALAQQDIERVPTRIALWHDESYLNRVFIDHPPTHVLAPSFMYPEPPVDEWLFSTDAPSSTRAAYMAGAGRRFVPRIHNLGVRKHVDMTLDKYQSQPQSTIVPEFMTSPRTTSRVLTLPGRSPRVKELVTIVAKAFERPQCLRRLLDSAARMYPGIEVIVLDDSERPSLSVEDIARYRAAPGGLELQYIRSEYDIGLSDGRNRLVELATTPFVLLVDDDFELKTKGGVEELLSALEGGGFDLAGGCVDSPQGDAWSYSFHESEGTLTLTPFVPCALVAAPAPPDYVSQGASCWRADFILNFFLARTEFLWRVKWDARLKLGEHEDFFLRVKDAGGRVAMCRGASAYNDNSCDLTEAYKEKRRRVFDYWVEFFLKRGLKKMVTPAGQYALQCKGASGRELCAVNTIQAHQDKSWFN